MEILISLFTLINERKQQTTNKSYTKYLLDCGIDKIGKKIGEEGMELVIAAKNNDYQETINESADLIYHILILLANQNIELNDVMQELEQRQQKMNNLKEPSIKGEL